MDAQHLAFNRVMIIDDTDVDRFIAKHTLSKNQFSTEIVEFEIARAALQFLIENINDPEKLPQLIFLDIRMPEMDGFEFLDEFVKLPPAISDIPVIMLSSSLNPADHQRAAEIGAVKKFVNKPLNKNIIEELKIMDFHHAFKNS